MIRSILKTTVLLSTYFWLKPRWRGLALVIVSIALTGIIHTEYLHYVNITGNEDFLMTSYILKWLVYLLSLLMYILVAILKPSTVAGTMPRDSTTGRKETVEGQAVEDGFDFLRQKTRLNNQADLLLTRDD